MVSTRGIKLKFSENERVLCYEPDPTKAKVLYDSKVLDVVINKDQRGRKSVEYLIHFQGWNSSWDRYVSEEYVLKDTPENRQLQRDLAEQSQLQLGAYLYRRDRKKHNRSKTGRSSDDGSSGSPTRMDTDVTSSSEDDSSMDDESIPIELTQDLREILELDFNLINIKNKLVKLPAEPNIVNILETYWQHYASSMMGGKGGSNRNRFSYNNNQIKRKPEDVQRNLAICKEVLDGLRIYFDYTVSDLLLYKSERGQEKMSQALYTSTSQLVKEEINRHDVDYADYVNNSHNSNDEDLNNVDASRPATRRRNLRSNKSVDINTNGNINPVEPTNNVKPSSSIGNNVAEVPNTTNKMNWRLLPDHVYSQQPPPPCLMYGAIHLLRLFVRLPELLNASNIEENKFKTVLQHLDSFIDFLNEHKEWYGEKFYIDK